MPVGNATVGHRPCVNGTELNRPAGAADLFRLEADSGKPECTKEDGRFEDLGFSISEFDVQKSSGVLAKLKLLPGYDVSDESKQATEYQFWGRPTAKWDCTKLEMTKTFDAINNATLRFERPAGLLAQRQFYYFLWIDIGFWLCTAICVFMKWPKFAYLYFVLKLVLDGFALMFLFNYIMFMADAKKTYEKH